MNTFTVTELELPGVFVIEPTVYADERGFSVNVFAPVAFKELGISAEFTEDFTSYSKKNIVRGLHFQRAPFMQNKLVRCTQGEVFDVAADCDPASPTYGKHVSVVLRGDKQTMVFIPGKYAHGFCVLSEEAIMEYKLSDTFHPEAAGGARYDDPLFDIPWPVAAPILSSKDTVWPPLSPIA